MPSTVLDKGSGLRVQKAKIFVPRNEKGQKVIQIDPQSPDFTCCELRPNGCFLVQTATVPVVGDVGITFNINGTLTLISAPYSQEIGVTLPALFTQEVGEIQNRHPTAQTPLGTVLWIQSIGEIDGCFLVLKKVEGKNYFGYVHQPNEQVVRLIMPSEDLYVVGPEVWSLQG